MRPATPDNDRAHAMRLCLLIPHYEHAGAIGALLDRLARYDLPCIVVDDGSGKAARDVLAELERRLPWVTIVWRSENGGQGAAKRTGYRHALAAGYTHSLELDADGQHDTDDVPRFVAAMRANPSAAVLGKPVFGTEAPKARLWGRQLSVGLVWLACGSRTVRDPLCGYRGLPLAAAVAIIDSVHTGNRMSFDPEMSVRLFRAGLPIVTLPTRVSYPTDGVSHFDMLRDNLRLAATYLRLLVELPLAAPAIVLARRRAQQQGGAASCP
ncbi:MAG TPA: glycosyltransferase family 2 protein [Candidatus Limnocylindrales bacterium]|nr:glycosyltransferase family 2 protein [Candidatus Limnocylindrales bacterium]